LRQLAYVTRLCLFCLRQHQRNHAIAHFGFDLVLINLARNPKTRQKRPPPGLLPYRDGENDDGRGPSPPAKFIILCASCKRWLWQPIGRIRSLAGEGKTKKELARNARQSDRGS
jgi:hypothetical protein